MALTALEVKSLTCPEMRSQIKKSDGKGLFILVKNNQSKLWRFKYKFAGKHQEMALGKYPSVSLSKARELAEEARLLLAQGINPMEQRRDRKSSKGAPKNEFGVVALEWWERQAGDWSEDHSAKVKRWLTKDTKSINSIPVDRIDERHIVDLMLAIEESGSPKKAPPILSVINRVFGYALAHRLTRTNPAQGLPLRDILKPLPKVKHRAAITCSKELASLIHDIDNQDSGSFCTIEALKLIPRLFLRPKEIRFLKWVHVDFKDKIIRIPAEKMKRDRDHLVPLADQVMRHLKELQSMTGYSTYVFPGEKSSEKPISKNVMTNRLRSLGYSGDVMSAHGFRSTASTLLHEKGWSHDAVEIQLAHLIGSPTSRAYNRAAHLAERRKMMQAWADFLDEIKADLT